MRARSFLTKGTLPPFLDVLELGGARRMGRPSSYRRARHESVADGRLSMLTTPARVRGPSSERHTLRRDSQLRQETRTHGSFCEATRGWPA